MAWSHSRWPPAAEAKECIVVGDGAPLALEPHRRSHRRGGLHSEPFTRIFAAPLIGRRLSSWGVLTKLRAVCYLYRVGQLNVNQTPEFEEDLTRLMRIRRISTKSEAVRVAVRESLERSLQAASECDYRSWIGLARGEGENLEPKIRSHDELWA